MRSLFILLCLISVDLMAWTTLSKVDEMHEAAYEMLDEDLDSAFFLATKSLTLSENSDYEWGIANSNYILGYVFWEKDQLSAALLHYLKGLRIFEKIDDERAIKNALKLYINCGSLLRKHYKYDESLTYYNKGIELADRTGNILSKIRLLYNKAHVLEDQSRDSEALDILKESLLLSRGIGSHSDIIKGLNLEGVIHIKQNALNKAEATFKELLKLNFISEKYKAMTYHNLGHCSMKESQYDSAEWYYQKALALKLELNQPDQIFTTLRDLTEVYFKQESYVMARKYAEKALIYYEDVRLDPDHYKIFKSLIRISYALGANTNAMNYSNRYFEESDKFVAHQQEVLEINQRFKTDLLLAGFHFENQVDEQYDNYQLVIFLITIGFLSLMALSFWRFKYLQRQIRLSLWRIEDEFSV